VTVAAFYYQGNDWNKLSDDIMIDIATNAYIKLLKTDPEHLSASTELSERITAIAHSSERTYAQIHAAADEIAEKYNLPYGIALPSISEESQYNPILARGTPLSHTTTVNMTELAMRLRAQKQVVRNSWEQLGDRSVVVIQTEDGPMVYWENHAGNRARKFIHGIEARMESSMTAEAELKAINLLKTKVTERQFRCYMLNNAFVERSPKSDLFYFFRKGLPVIAFSYHGYEAGKILACLCIHPYGYFEFTHAGVMCPTDEVIGQLLLMRASEKKFWAKAGQWSPSDPRSGL